MYTTACINIKRYLFAQTLLPHINAGITGFFLCGFQRDPSLFFCTGALCLLRQLIQITGRRKKWINIRTSDWGKNGRDWLKSATYFKSLVPTWTYVNENDIHLRNGLCPLGIATRVCRILARWSLAPELPIGVPMLCADQHFCHNWVLYIEQASPC